MTARTMYMATLILYRAAVCGLLVGVGVTLTGCSGEPDRNILLVDPATGCEWIMTQYGVGEVLGDSYVKPRTDASGVQLCAEKGDA